ncbi:MAG: SnoaL-like domain [Idiomarinaceae bacterium HL-53]|nr:MAG: SnoaL-like domain [Idiomarinaceae bacterium HL-53]CUS48897.1 SnoaL-like domain-containing protein [Idiomarinaceae bacterium HL-53]
MTHDPLIEQIQSFYQRIDAEHLEPLRQIYAENVLFEDPVHRIEGIEKLINYFRHGLANADTCLFDIEEIVTDNERIILKWTMTLKHSKLNRGEEFHVPGVSFLKRTENGKQIAFHRDYFDLGDMFYERLPIVRRIIGALKNRMKSE